MLGSIGSAFVGESSPGFEKVRSIGRKRSMKRRKLSIRKRNLSDYKDQALEVCPCLGAAHRSGRKECSPIAGCWSGKESHSVLETLTFKLILAQEGSLPASSPEGCMERVCITVTLNRVLCQLWQLGMERCCFFSKGGQMWGTRFNSCTVKRTGFSMLCLWINLYAWTLRGRTSSAKYLGMER